MRSFFNKFWASTILVNITFGIIYIYIFRVIYVDYLEPTFGYMGYEINHESLSDIIICDILLIIPILFYKPLRRISDFIAIMIYIFVYVPSLVSIQYFWGCDDEWGYMLAFFVSMVLFFIASSHKVSQSGYVKKVGNLNIRFFLNIGFVLTLLLLIVFRNNLHMVSFAEVYNLREENSDVGAGFPMIGYFQMWCQNLFSPLFIVIGLYRKNKKIMMLGFFVALLIFMSTGLKSSIISPFIVFVFYHFMQKYMSNNIKIFFPAFTIFLGFLLITSFFIEGDIADMAYAIIFMRSVGISAQLAPCYISVFSSHSYTYYSHINIINKVTNSYPFSDPSLGNAVWTEYTGSNDMNANANFLLTDGTAAMGVLGVYIVSVIFYFLLVYLNKLTRIHDQTLVFSLFIPIIMSITNASLFTTLLSSGLIIGMIIFRYCTFNKNKVYERS